MNLPRDHFSPSQSGMFARCGQQYQFRYIEGLVIPPALAMLSGGSVHTAAEANHRHKVEAHQDLPASDLEDIAAESFEIRIAAEGVSLTQDESMMRTKSIGNAKDRTVKLTGHYRQAAAPHIVPLSAEHIERRVEVPLGGDFPPLLCILDVVEDDGTIDDLKTKGAKPIARQVETSVQYTAYYLARLHETQVLPPMLTQHTVVCTKKAGKLSYVPVHTTRTRQDIQAMLNRMGAQMRAISAGVFPPCDPSAWNCCEGWCGFWHRCPYINVHGGRKDG